jgi:hypothetical protein
MNETVSRPDVLHAIPAAGRSGPGLIGWSIGRLSWPSSACMPFVNLRRRVAQHVRRQAAEMIEEERTEIPRRSDAVDTHLATFVAIENVKRYRAILDMQPREADRQVITALLFAEECRVERLARSSGNRGARASAASRVQSRQWQVALTVTRTGATAA